MRVLPLSAEPFALQSRPMSPRLQTFREFWPYYLGEHSKAWTRRLHFVGTSGAIASLAAFAFTGRPALLLAAAICGYAFAWISHLAIEHNRPATFRYPLYSLAADFRMYGLTLLGKLELPVIDKPPSA